MREHRWLIFMMALLTVVVVPQIVNAVLIVTEWNEPGYREDIIPFLAFDLALLAPALILGAAAVWMRNSAGRLVVTVGCVILAASELLGWGLALSSDSSTAASVFIPVKAVQILTAIICGVIVAMTRSLAPEVAR